MNKTTEERILNSLEDLHRKVNLLGGRVDFLGGRVESISGLVYRLSWERKLFVYVLTTTLPILAAAAVNNFFTHSTQQQAVSQTQTPLQQK